MSNFRIVKGIDSALKGGGKKLLEIDFLGIGGAFDTDEGTSSALLKTRGGKLFLIDCGHSAYSKLRKKGLIDKIDTIFITHTHSGHISHLSTFVYDSFLVHKKPVTIECTQKVSERIKSYLDLCGHPEESYQLNTSDFVFIEDEKISITKIDTSDYHWPVNNFPNSGLLFHFDTSVELLKKPDDYAIFIYSGDINIPITNLMDPTAYPFVYENPDNVFIFHDMTSFDYPQNPHCNFELLKPIRSEFKNLFTYHHNQEQVYNVNKESSQMALTSLILQGNSFVIEELKGL